MRHVQLLTAIGTRHKTSQCIVALAHTALHIGFILILEIGLVLSQVEVLLQVNQDFRLLGVCIGDI